MCTLPLLAGDTYPERYRRELAPAPVGCLSSFERRGGVPPTMSPLKVMSTCHLFLRHPPHIRKDREWQRKRVAIRLFGG